MGANLGTFNFTIISPMAVDKDCFIYTYDTVLSWRNIIMLFWGVVSCHISMRLPLGLDYFLGLALRSFYKHINIMWCWWAGFLKVHAWATQVAPYVLSVLLRLLLAGLHSQPFNWHVFVKWSIYKATIKLTTKSQERL